MLLREETWFCFQRTINSYHVLDLTARTAECEEEVTENPLTLPRRLLWLEPGARGAVAGSVSDKALAVNTLSSSVSDVPALNTSFRAN